MKNLVYFSLVVLLLGVGGCKKDLCHGVVCQNGGHCVDGVCVCDTTWTGTLCQTPVCGLHQHIVNHICVCDTGWAGANCDTLACIYYHLGSLKIIYNNTDYTYKVYLNGVNTDLYVDANHDVVFDSVPAASNSLTFTSVATCIGGSGGTVPCSIKHATIIVNECQQTNYTLY